MHVSIFHMKREIEIMMEAALKEILTDLGSLLAVLEWFRELGAWQLG